MGKGNFTEELKLDAIKQITERDYSVADVSKRLGLGTHSLYAWMPGPRISVFFMADMSWQAAHNGASVSGITGKDPLFAARASWLRLFATRVLQCLEMSVRSFSFEAHHLLFGRYSCSRAS